MPTNIYSDKEELCDAAAELIADIAQQDVTERGQFTIALSGGSTPRQLYELLASPGWHQIDWTKWQIFWSDERMVPLDDEASNFGMAEETLLSRLDIDPLQIHAVPVDSGSPDEAAAAYEQTIRSLVPACEKDRPLPCFDLVLLGLGSDGHTASLFPDKPTLTESQKLVTTTTPGILPPPVDRVTFTFPLINAAHNVVFLIVGNDKTQALHAAQNHEPLDGEIPPAASVAPEHGTLYWLVDAEAATIIETD